MKKKLACVLAVCLMMTMALSACGSDEKDVAGSITPAASSQPSAPASSVKAPDASEQPGVLEENAMSVGRIVGGTYTNTYLGFAMELDSTWEYYTAEELQELPENVDEIFEGTELEEIRDDLEQFNDMMAESVEELASINILYQKQDMQTRLFFSALTDDEILDAVLEESGDMIKESYAQGGLNVQSMEKVTVAFCGEEVPALKTVCDMEGINYYVLQVFDYHTGAYSATITFGSFVEDKTEQLIAMCYAI